MALNTSTTLTDTRLHGLDFLRALMMTLGIVLHGAQMYMTMHLGFDYYRDPVMSMTMDGVLIFINTFRMPVFFTLSGFFTAMLLVRYGLNGMLTQRAKRIALPFLLFLPPLSLLLGLQWIASAQLSATGSLGMDASYLSHPRALWDNTHHLWFLYYLMILLLITAAVVYAWRYTPDAISNNAQRLGSKLRGESVGYVIALGLLIGWIALPRYFGRVNGAPWFMPYMPAVLTFGLCFLAGWLLYFRKACLDVLANRCWTYLGTAMLCFCAALYAFLNQGEPDGPEYAKLHPILAFGNGLAVAFFIAGFTGLFHRYYNNYRPRVRYFSDASYWIFMLHQPVLIFLAWPMHSWAIAAELKFLIVSVGTLAICVWTYDVFVRNSAIGALLSGRRYPRGLPAG